MNKTQKQDENYRVLAIDDDEQVLDAYQSIFSGNSTFQDALNAFNQAIGEPTSGVNTPIFSLTTANNGEAGVESALQFKASETPFAVAFIDMRMPNGIDGLETAKRLREIDNQLYLVIVSAYSDHDFDTIRNALDQRVIYISKPFKHIEIEQIAYHHCRSWQRDRMLDTLLDRREKQIRQQDQMFELYKSTSHSVKTRSIS